MKKDEYFRDHLPHRVNLLTTFRDRYSRSRALKRGRRRRKLDAEEARDLFRCAKDIAMVMVRVLCDEMGLYLNDKGYVKKRRRGRRYTGIKTFTLEEARKDPRYEKLEIVLKAASRAVAHIFPDGVDHPIKVDADNEILFDVIDWVEELVETHIYDASGESFEDAMKYENNDMDSPPHLTKDSAGRRLPDFTR